MINSIDEYLDALRSEMQGSDPALLQDALADAREHLSVALDEVIQEHSDIKESDALKTIIDEYGTPGETATAYKEVERRTEHSFKQSPKSRSLLGRFFGVYIDPRTWGSLLFLVISLVTGIIYFTWAVTGLSLSLGFMILIIGVPFTFIFLLSVQGLTLLEGRLVDALLGVRMPRRPLFAKQGLKWLERLKALITDKHTWLSLIYLVLQLPLGVIYFSLLITLISISLSLMAVPFIHFVPINLNPMPDQPGYHGPLWLLTWWGGTLTMLLGFLGMTLTMHLSRGLGWLHGLYAKWMLVS